MPASNADDSAVAGTTCGPRLILHAFLHAHLADADHLQLQRLPLLTDPRTLHRPATEVVRCGDARAQLEQHAQTLSTTSE
jgi:hypothetical protein